MSLFYRDTITNEDKTWEELIADLERVKFTGICGSKDSYYYLFIQIIKSLLTGEHITIYSEDISNQSFRPLSIPLVSSKEELIKLLYRKADQWSMTLFTSGTTGVPKKVTHTFKSISRFVKISDKMISNIWGLAYNPTHIAGIQVYLQALFNGNAIIRLFGLTKDKIYSEIEKCQITNISATPTFYRLILPSSRVCYSVKNITSGGERFDERTIMKLKNVFPNAKISNIYASTEAGSLLASQGDVFTVKEGLRLFIKVKDSELLINKFLMAKTDCSFDEWYSTGDLVEIVSDNPLSFRFISRQNETINVGGYKVNPYEVEETIRSISGILDTRVYSKRNSVLGNVVCCEVVRERISVTEVYIRQCLQQYLQEYKIPRIITFVKELNVTRTGKLKR